MKKFPLACLLAFAPIVSLAATITLSDTTCAAFAATDDGNGNLTLKCSTAGAKPSEEPTPAPTPTPTPTPTTSGPSTGTAANCAEQGLRNVESAFDWEPGYLKRFAMGANQSYSFKLSVNEGDAGKITTVYGGAQKIISVSTKQCDFSQALIAANCLGAGGDPVIAYVAGTSRMTCMVTPGQTYYVNIRNAVLDGAVPIYPIQDSCTGGCEFSITY